MTVPHPYVPAAVVTPATPAGTRIGLVLLILGLVLLFASLLAAQGGTVLPCDRHHLVGQAGGVALSLVGVRLRD